MPTDQQILKVQRVAVSQVIAFTGRAAGPWIARPPYVCFPTPMTLRIVADAREDGTIIRLIGRMRAEHVEHVRAEIDASRAPAALDLDEVTLADVDAVRFLVAAERQGIVLQHCAPFIREWMAREADRT